MKKKTILLVDDSELIFEMEETILGDENYEYFYAKDLATARKIVEVQPLDLILLDLYLPDGTGMDFCRELRNDESTRDISVIMVTVSQEDEDKEKCFMAGCNDFIIKPIDANELRYKVAKLISIAPRITYRILVKVTPIEQKDSPYLFGTTVNLSETGMMIESKSKLEVGSEVNLSFFLTTSKENLNIKGKIVRCDSQGFGGATGYGILFMEMTEENRKNIIGLIQKQTYGKNKENSLFFAGEDN